MRSTISPAIFRSLFGILSRPAALLSFNLDNSLRTTSTVGAFRENIVFVASRPLPTVITPDDHHSQLELGWPAAE